MSYKPQTHPAKVPTCAIGMFMLLSLTACGKVAEPVVYHLTPAREIALKASIQGQVKLIGGLPKNTNQRIDTGSNPFCAGHGQLVNPTWRISDTGGLADVVVSLNLSDRATNLVDASPLVDQKHCEFVPYMTVLQPGQTLKLRNSDLTFHNIRVVRHEAGTLNGGVNLVNLAQPARGDENEYLFNEPGVYRLECDVHRWMKAWVYVGEGVYIAATDKDGRFEINRSLPDADYELTAWHPMFAEPVKKKITVSQGKAVANFNFSLLASLQR